MFNTDPDLLEKLDVNAGIRRVRVSPTAHRLNELDVCLVCTAIKPDKDSKCPARLSLVQNNVCGDDSEAHIIRAEN